MTKVAIVGGGSPFTIDLIDELVRAIPDVSLSLHGRDPRALARVATYATAVHRRRTHFTLDLATSIDGAASIVLQARFGGLEGRASDAALAASYGIAADETLGPGGLAAALRAATP